MKQIPRTRSVPGRALAACLLLLTVLSVRAEDALQVIRLRTGETLKVRVVKKDSDLEVLIVEDAVSGGVRRLPWNQLEPADRDRIQRAWHWRAEAIQPVDGECISMLKQDGTELQVCGRVVGEDETHLHVRRGGEVLHVPKGLIRGRVPRRLDPRVVWSPAQLVVRYLDALANGEGVDIVHPTPSQRLRIATFAWAVADIEAAREHYAACAKDADTADARVARQQLAEADVILKDPQGLAAVRRIRATLWRCQFRQVRQMLEDFAEDHGDASAPLLRLLARTEKDFRALRAKCVQRRIVTGLPRAAKELIDARVRVEGATLSDVVAWTRRELPDAAFSLVVERLDSIDDVTPEEALALWRKRPVSAWSSATYGPGTFIVDPPRPRGARPRRGPPPHGPPTRDQWWKRASHRDRAAWTMAYFAERSGLFELSTETGSKICAQCGGSGASAAGACPACGASGRIRTVRYR